MKASIKLTVVLLAAGVAALPVQAQAWKKKEYSKWSENDCRKLLSDSPWASSYTIGTVLFQPVNEESAVGGRDMAPQVTYAAQFWSAKPVRQAIARLQQLDDKYEKLPAEQKAALDERLAQFLNMEFPEQIVIQVSYSGSQAFMLSVARFWKQKTEGDLKQSFTLVMEGRRIAPAQVVVAQGGANEMQLIFPRRMDGEPIVTASSKEIRLEIDDPNETVRIPFKVKDMKIGEELIY
ncbi:MAG: hypothetical protein ACRD6I_02350 [Candidatus Acidiferrales bacterium]